MAPARAVVLALGLAVPAAAAGGGPVAGRPPSASEVALTSATLAYKAALERYNGYVVLNGSVQDEEAVALHAAKEAARRAMIRAENAAGGRHGFIAPQDGPLTAPAPAVQVPSEDGPRPSVPPAGRGAILAGGLVVGGALAGVGAFGWWKKRPRTLACPGCGRKLKVPGRGLKARCPKCKKVFEA